MHPPTAPIVGDPVIDFDDVAYEPDGWERYARETLAKINASSDYNTVFPLTRSDDDGK